MRGQLRHSAGPRGHPPIPLVTTESRPLLQKIGPRVTPNLFLLTPLFACPKGISFVPDTVAHSQSSPLKPHLAAPPGAMVLRPWFPWASTQAWCGSCKMGLAAGAPHRSKAAPYQEAVDRARDRGQMPRGTTTTFPTTCFSRRDQGHQPTAVSDARCESGGCPFPTEGSGSRLAGHAQCARLSPLEVSCPAPPCDPLRSQAALRRRSAMPGWRPWFAGSFSPSCTCIY